MRRLGSDSFSDVALTAINTSDIEAAPFLSSDATELYFSSNLASLAEAGAGS